MIILNAVSSILCIVIIIIIGYYLAKKGWFNENSTNLISKLVTVVSLPPLMVYTFVTTFSRDMLIKSSSGLIIPFLSIAICFAISIVISKLFIIKSRQGVFQTMFTLSNTIFIGLPVNLALFGEKSVPYALLYYIANTTFFWTLGILVMSRDGNAQDVNIFSKNTLKALFSPPLVSFMIGVFLVLLEIHLPKFVLDTCKYLGNLTTPLSLIFLGITFSSINIRDFSIGKDTILLFLGRFIISPLLVVGLAYIVPVHPLMLKVFVIQAAMPVMAQTAVIASTYNADYKYATLMISITTFASMIVIPLYMVLLSFI